MLSDTRGSLGSRMRGSAGRRRSKLMLRLMLGSRSLREISCR